MRKYSRYFKSILHIPTNLYEEFHSKTKIEHFDEVDQKDWPKEWSEIFHKGYGRFEEVVLGPPKMPKVSLKDALYNRKSSRNFLNQKKATLDELSTLLYFGSGVKPESNLRFYPSAGARYPLEVYIIPLRFPLSGFIYHYYLKNHSLEKLFTYQVDEVYNSFYQDFVKEASYLIIITAVFKRLTNKYGNRGYRYIYTEVGHMMQNYYLCSSALKLACCSIGGHKEQSLEKILDIDGINESVVSVLAIS